MRYLFAVPGAGAGPSEFVNWEETLGEGIAFRRALYNNKLAGEASLCDDIKEAARRVADRICEETDPADEIWLFGHCMGASIAYEAAVLLDEERGIKIKGLFVAAFISPDTGIEDGISDLDDDAFADEIESHGVFPEEFFANRSLLKLFLPAIRADYRMIENYRDLRHYVLDCPIMGFYGTDDCEVRPEDAEGWRNYTSREYTSMEFPGDHYFYYGRQQEIAGIIRKRIESYDCERGNGSD